MSDAILPLLLLPAVVGWWVTEWKQRATRPILRTAIRAAHAPLLHDAGTSSVLTVARALETMPAPDPRPCPWWLVGRRRTAWDIQQLVAPLGLELTDVIGTYRDRLGRPAGFVGASRFAGCRHGRAVQVELGVDTSAITITVADDLPVCRLWADRAGALHAGGDVPAPLAAALETLSASRHWIGVSIDVDGAEVALRRPDHVTGSWLHDLWLAEFVVDLASQPVRVRDAARVVALA